MADRRVQFDFDIEFSNGGSLKGEGFRLDIEGDDISDQALAGHPHRRAPVPPRPRAGLGLPVLRRAGEGEGVRHVPGPHVRGGLSE
jgi:hypothetical protein